TDCRCHNSKAATSAEARRHAGALQGIEGGTACFLQDDEQDDEGWRWRKSTDERNIPVTDVVVQRVGQGDSSASKQGQPPARLPDAMVLLQGVAKTYRTAAGEAIEALQRIDLTIAAEEFVSVIGASGCGKTTLLRIMAGLEPEYGGELWLD